MDERRQESAQPFEVLNQMYELSAAKFGRPIEFHLFDDRMAEVLDIEWLADQVKDIGVSEPELRSLKDMGILRTYAAGGEKEGFLLYTPEHVKAFISLRDRGQYSNDELIHIMMNWSDDIECTLEVLPYDDPEISNFENYRRRIQEHISETKNQIRWLSREASNIEPSEQLKDFERELNKWERLANRVDAWNQHQLTEEMQDRIDRALFQMRWVDEWVRVGNAERFRSRIMEGYSPEVFFNRFIQDSSGFKFDQINWRLTLQAVRRTRSSGKRFPLRTPDFDLSESGLLLRKLLSAADYVAVRERYQMSDLEKALSEFESDIWSPQIGSVDSSVCAECGAAFVRSVAAKRYCSQRCRSRAKQRRYREKDPERARLAQARYWKNYSEDC